MSHLAISKNFSKKNMFFQKKIFNVLSYLTIPVAFYGKFATIWLKKIHGQKSKRTSFSVRTQLADIGFEPALLCLTLKIADFVENLTDFMETHFMVKSCNSIRHGNPNSSCNSKTSNLTFVMNLLTRRQSCSSQYLHQRNTSEQLTNTIDFWRAAMIRIQLETSVKKLKYREN